MGQTEEKQNKNKIVQMVYRSDRMVENGFIRGKGLNIIVSSVSKENADNFQNFQITVTPRWDSTNLLSNNKHAT